MPAVAHAVAKSDNNSPEQRRGVMTALQPAFNVVGKHAMGSLIVGRGAWDLVDLATML